MARREMTIILRRLIEYKTSQPERLPGPDQIWTNNLNYTVVHEPKLNALIVKE